MSIQAAFHRGVAPLLHLLTPLDRLMSKRNQMCFIAAILFIGCVAPQRTDAAIPDCRWPIIFPKVSLQRATIEEVVAMLQRQMICIEGSRANLNFVLFKQHLSQEELSRRVTWEERDVSIDEVFYAVCRSMGLGYKVEPYAFVISSRSHVGLPPPPSERVKDIPDGAQRKGLVVFKFRQK